MKDFLEKMVTLCDNAAAVGDLDTFDVLYEMSHMVRYRSLACAERQGGNIARAQDYERLAELALFRTKNQISKLD